MADKFKFLAENTGNVFVLVTSPFLRGLYLTFKKLHNNILFLAFYPSTFLSTFIPYFSSLIISHTYRVTYPTTSLIPHHTTLTPSPHHSSLMLLTVNSHHSSYLLYLPRPSSLTTRQSPFTIDPLTLPPHACKS